MSHTVIDCTCRVDELCPVPGHGHVPPGPVDPWVLVDAGTEALRHLDDAVRSVVAARAAWVSRGLLADNRFPRSLDRLAGGMVNDRRRLRAWTTAAKTVAERRSGPEEPGPEESEAT